MANIDNVQLPDGSSYNIVDNTSGFATQNYVDSAVDSVTKTTIGLGNVDNTSDLSKPISTATQTALNTLDEGKAEKTDIATVESGTTASRAYSVGELVYVSGTLYRVKTDIVSGATFTVGTNIEVTNVSDACKSIINLTNITCNNGTFTGNVYIKNGVAFIYLTITRTDASVATAVIINGLNAVLTNSMATSYVGWQPEQQSQQAIVVQGNRLTIKAGGFVYVNVSVVVPIN